MEKFLTPQGKEKVQKDLSELKLRIPEIAERISEAKEKGDLSENAEYSEAKEEHRRIQEEITRLKNLLNTAKTVEKKDSDSVCIGSKVTVKKNGEEKTYILVGSEESDLSQTLLEKKVGDKATFETPKGENELSIIKIE